jgi:hypothetical protein
VNWSDPELPLVPPGPETVTSTVPAISGGEVAVIEEGELTVKLVAAVVPKSTAVVPVKFVPVIVTEVPPVVAPEVGDTTVTLGVAATAGVAMTTKPTSTLATAISSLATTDVLRLIGGVSCVRIALIARSIDTHAEVEPLAIAR